MTTSNRHGLSPASIETLAGLSAGLVSTIVVHPLDIIKTRLQGKRTVPLPLNMADPVQLTLRPTLCSIPPVLYSEISSVMKALAALPLSIEGSPQTSLATHVDGHCTSSGTVKHKTLSAATVVTALPSN